MSFDVDRLPATQYLILDVLAARHRTGEPFWTFPARMRRALEALTAAGMVTFYPHDSRLRAELTAAGRDEVFNQGFLTPDQRENAQLRDEIKRINATLAELLCQRAIAQAGLTSPAVN